MIRTAITAAALAGFATAAAASEAGGGIFDLSPTYVGLWVDPNFNDPTTGMPVQGSAVIDVELINGETQALISMNLGGNPGGSPLPAFSAIVDVNGDGTVNASGIEVPDLDADTLFMTGGDFSPTPLLDMTLSPSGMVEFTIFDALGFTRIEASGIWDTFEFNITADVFADFGNGVELISSGGTVVAEGIPAPAGAATLALAGLGFTRRRRA